MNEIKTLQKDEDIESILSSNSKVIVLFKATWCAPCRQLSLLLESKILKEESSLDWLFVYVDVDVKPDLAHSLNLRSVPTMVKYIDGKLVDMKIGVVDYAHFESWLREEQPNV